ncbi:MAG: phage head closure protein [Paracoccaceae bacterium]
MTAPRLNRQLALEVPERVADGSGGYTESWAERGRLWAEIRSTPAGEATLGAALVSRVNHRIVVRAAPHGAPSRPTAAHRFREGGRVYRILSVTEADSSGRHLLCNAVEEIAP